MIPALIVFAVLVTTLLLVAMFKSDDFRVSRSLQMAAPSSKIFDQVNDLRCMSAWNPFLKLDPNAQVAFEGARSGVGAVCVWDGDKNVGAGRQTIIESQPNKLVRMSLEFYRPFPGVNDVEFLLVDEGTSTTVTWNMVGRMSFVPRLVGIFMNMEKMCGASFLSGLKDVKTIVES